MKLSDFCVDETFVVRSKSKSRFGGTIYRKTTESIDAGTPNVYNFDTGKEDFIGPNQELQSTLAGGL